MAKITELKKYLGYEFSSGCYTGEDYRSFQTKYKTNVFTSPSATSGISIMNGTITFSFARRKTKLITKAVSITIPPSTDWK